MHLIISDNELDDCVDESLLRKLCSLLSRFGVWCGTRRLLLSSSIVIDMLFRLFGLDGDL